jgi:hypothetical protein
MLTQAHTGWLLTAVLAQTPVPPTPQNPSPMIERSRPHERIEQRALPGTRRTIEGLLGKPVEMFIPASTSDIRMPNLVVHFHGAAFVAEHAVARLGRGYVLAVVNLGAGSGIYDRSFDDPAVFDSLLSRLVKEISGESKQTIAPGRIILSGFSAGHGAIRAILRHSAHFDRVDAVLLLDGLHTSYEPERKVLGDGGQLDTKNLEVFVRFGRLAVQGTKRLLITHSEIFPGTFASTTETVDYLVDALGLRRTPVLRQGPVGMQQIGETVRGNLAVLGFAGNTAPDHVDHFHGMPEFLRRLLR